MLAFAVGFFEAVLALAAGFFETAWAFAVGFLGASAFAEDFLLFVFFF
ncbi:MAG: hypothetical protein AAFV29_14665 [Myxococcota bacterium]